MLRDIDLDSFKTEVFQGADLAPPYQPPSFPPLPTSVIEGVKAYNGNCHCGAVTYTVVTESLEEQRVISCNCSLCSRVCYVLFPSHSFSALQPYHSLLLCSLFLNLPTNLKTNPQYSLELGLSPSPKTSPMLSYFFRSQLNI